MGRPIDKCATLSDLIESLRMFEQMGHGKAVIANEDGCPFRHMTLVAGVTTSELVLSFEDGK